MPALLNGIYAAHNLFLCKELIDRIAKSEHLNLYSESDPLKMGILALDFKKRKKNRR